MPAVVEIAALGWLSRGSQGDGRGNLGVPGRHGGVLVLHFRVPERCVWGQGLKSATPAHRGHPRVLGNCCRYIAQARWWGFTRPISSKTALLPNRGARGIGARGQPRDRTRLEQGGHRTHPRPFQRLTLLLLERRPRQGPLELEPHALRMLEPQGCHEDPGRIFMHPPDPPPHQATTPGGGPSPAPGRDQAGGGFPEGGVVWFGGGGRGGGAYKSGP